MGPMMGPPMSAVNDKNKLPKPKSIKEVPSYIKKTVGGFFSRLFYIFKLVWETRPWILFVMMFMAIFDGAMPVVGAVISKDIINELSVSYGKGEELEMLRVLSQNLGIEDAVHFPGHSTKIHEIMADSAMFVLSSNYEGLSNSMLEALAVGIPTICTDCPPGGAREFITDGVNGMLIPVGDTEALTEKLCLLADHPELCAKISAEAIKVRDRLDPQRILSQWEDVLTKE